MSNSEPEGRDASDTADRPDEQASAPADAAAESASGEVKAEGNTEPAPTEAPALDEIQEEASDEEVVVAEVEVGIERSVRLNRLLIVGAIVGVVVMSLISLSFPVTEESQFTMAQIVGFMALIGGVLGLALGGILGLILTVVAKRQRGTGVATQVDVR